jgi:hypothetical protein
MSEEKDTFLRAVGRANPRTPPGLSFSNDWKGEVWEALHDQVGAGYFWDRFLFLFGEGLQSLQPCLKAWSFLVPDDGAERMIVGYNAHGALLVLENPNEAGPKSRVSIVDPVGVVYRRYADLDFVGLIGYWIPEMKLREFLDRRVYDSWRGQHGKYLEPRQILAAKKPLGLGGTMALENFQVEEIVSYYRTTAPIYAKAFAQMSHAKPGGKKSAGKSTSKKGRR